MELLKNLYKVFFPSTFKERYRYLGYIPYEDDELFNLLLPLILTADFFAKPKWCPRWLLRLVHLLGNGNTVYFINNSLFHKIYKKLTNGVLFLDYKLKWTDYDLRITIYGNDLLQNLANDIEGAFYEKGRKNFILNKLDELNVNKDEYSKFDSLDKLELLYSKIIENKI